MVSILNKPSSLIHEICIEQVDGWKLFKFSEALQQRMETLLEKKKANKTVDVIIATFCIENDHFLLFSNKDFIPFVQYLGFSNLECGEF